MHETNTASARHSHPEGGCPSGTGGPDQVCLSDNERDKGSSTAQSVTELAFSVIESPYSSYYAREVEKLERDIARLERFEIGSSLVGDVARTIELIAPAGAIVGIISKFLGYVKSIKTIKLEALGLVRSAVETTLFMQSTMVKVEWNVPPEMLDSIKHFYEVLKDCTSSMYRVVDKTSFLHEVLNRNKYRDMLKDMSSRLLSARHDFTQSAIIISASYTYRLMPSHSGHAEAEKQLDDIDLRKTLAETARVEREKLGEFLGLDDLTLDEMVELRDAIGARRRARAGTAHEPSASSSIARPPVAITQATSSRDQDLVDSGRHTVLFMLNEIVYDNDPYNPPLSDTSLKEASITEDLVDVFLDRVHEVLSEKIAEQLKNREIASPSPKAEKVIQAVQAYESMTAESGNEGNGKGRSQSAKLSQTIQPTTVGGKSSGI
ncbi:uncharacterized protein I303_107878 [Kwoniella dejecticola CBS 10117]|uniref:Uncharacterized protein n=1 Tax=Kwoniella dejecticola CBS 10117 TaxID=1296121 RepID=A0A1A5ZVY1_9TREE|nr:uncharacterized protein I303_07881 [Kwoniella dejecticola CBS 10117]OBR81968.1 hypothetical protein I303_07881 [Kwoniella dejecticola CBS 10117]